ncbi:hypothetical protein HHI36_010452 [Cryptolaemus montrouzieri]|uniref:Ammonium transporter AmtB-like domain-containing protein n=1 Tax=Cryptolaemus montrouzieri TaxID=559131 RepID=A0ABD2MIR8_9CUCU
MAQYAKLYSIISKKDSFFLTNNSSSLVDADVATAAVLISMGAVLGTTTYLQLLLMGVVEIFLYCVNSFIGSTLLMVSDVGGSIFVHIFGAYFGLGVSYSLGRKQSAGSKLESSRYTSDLFAMIGTVFLWIYWPSFNAISLPSQQQHRAIINTYLSLASCCVTAFAISSCVTPYTKFDMVHIQNSTLAGGVAIGTSANLLIQPYGAVLVGILAGTLSVYGYKKLTPVINTRLKIHDTCGVHNLHGMPGILGGLSGAFFASLATVEEYQESLYLIFPARSGGADGRNEGRNSYEQAGFQILFMIITITFAIFSGCITGICIGLRFFRMKSQQFYNDAPFWKEPEDVFLPPTRVNIRQKSQSQIIFPKSNQDL